MKESNIQPIFAKILHHKGLFKLIKSIFHKCYRNCAVKIVHSKKFVTIHSKKKKSFIEKKSSHFNLYLSSL